MDENQNTSPENYCHVCESLLWNIKGDQHEQVVTKSNQGESAEKFEQGQWGAHNCNNIGLNILAGAQRKETQTRGILQSWESMETESETQVSGGSQQG